MKEEARRAEAMFGVSTKRAEEREGGGRNAPLFHQLINLEPGEEEALFQFTGKIKLRGARYVAIEEVPFLRVRK